MKTITLKIHPIIRPVGLKSKFNFGNVIPVKTVATVFKIFFKQKNKKIILISI